jgi:hypothetical protein
VKVKEYNASISKCQKSEKETHDKCANILAKEIDSWSNYDDALSEENRLVFNIMLCECRHEDLVRAFSSKDEFLSAESLFMVLILCLLHILIL